ncbi:MAG: hypothetical protein RIT81_41010 [Deltaproteobacteria bacterium]
MPKKKKKSDDKKKDAKKAKKAPKKRAAKKRVAKNPAPEACDDATLGSAALISDAQLTTLRGGYDRQVLQALALRAFETPFPPAAGVAKAIIAGFYAGDEACGGLSFRDRELALLARGVDRPDMNFVTHVYFALMEGVSPSEVLSVCYLTSLYGGADLWTGASSVVTKTFEALAKAANAGGKSATTLGVLGALRGTA